ncbi:hypothetical protein Tco_0200881 [Tanacetum coccineum]
MMRETKVHKFSDGTLTRILEKLDVMVIDYVLFKFNPGMVHRIWSEDDKRRSQEFKSLLREGSRSGEFLGVSKALLVEGLLGTTLSTLEVLEGLVLKILGVITLTVCITFDSRIEGAEFEGTGLDKAFVLSTLGRTEDFGIGVTE